MTTGDAKESWIYKNKEGGMQAAAASLGMILLWDIDEGLAQIDKYMEASDDHIVAGSYLAIGIVNCGIRNEMDFRHPFRETREQLQADSQNWSSHGTLNRLCRKCKS